MPRPAWGWSMVATVLRTPNFDLLSSRYAMNAFDRLSDELLILLCTHSDCLFTFGMINQRCRAISLEPYCQASHFLYHYGPAYAIYHAIMTMPRFTPDLFRSLIRKGALLSRALCQILQVPNGSDLGAVAGPEFQNASQRLSLAARRAIEGEAVRLYGKSPRSYQLADSHHDFWLLPIYLRSWRPNQEADEAMVHCVRETRLLPLPCLPFSFAGADNYPDNPGDHLWFVYRSIASYPPLLPSFIAAGFETDDLSMDRLWRCVFRTGIEGRRSAGEVCEVIQQLLELRPELWIRPSVAAQIVLAYGHEANDEQDDGRRRQTETAYRALQLCSSAGLLRYSLPALVLHLLLFSRDYRIETSWLGAHPSLDDLLILDFGKELYPPDGMVGPHDLFPWMPFEEIDTQPSAKICPWALQPSEVIGILSSCTIRMVSLDHLYFGFLPDLCNERRPEEEEARALLRGLHEAIVEKPCCRRVFDEICDWTSVWALWLDIGPEFRSEITAFIALWRTLDLPEASTAQDYPVQDRLHHLSTQIPGITEWDQRDLFDESALRDLGMCTCLRCTCREEDRPRWECSQHMKEGSEEVVHATGWAGKIVWAGSHR